MAWMAWTWPTALFFAAIATALVVMTVLELVRPTIPRRGLLPLVTSRGDRFFITLLASAFIHAGWLGITELPVYLASIGCLIVGGVLMRFG
jgi:predicted small integral membrane protein